MLTIYEEFHHTFNTVLSTLQHYTVWVGSWTREAHSHTPKLICNVTQDLASFGHKVLMVFGVNMDLSLNYIVL